MSAIHEMCAIWDVANLKNIFSSTWPLYWNLISLTFQVFQIRKFHFRKVLKWNTFDKIRLLDPIFLCCFYCFDKCYKSLNEAFLIINSRHCKVVYILQWDRGQTFWSFCEKYCSLKFCSSLCLKLTSWLIEVGTPFQEIIIVLNVLKFLSNIIQWNIQCDPFLVKFQGVGLKCLLMHF